MTSLPVRLTTIILSALAGCAAHAAELETTTPVAAKTNGEKWWNGNCKRIMTDLRKMEGEVDVAFVGDSITARWGNGENWTKHWGAYRAVNMGIGGDRTQNVLWRLQNGQLDGYKAKLFVVMIGTNNVDKKTAPEDVAAGIKAVLELIQSKQPQAKILLMGILPRGEKPDANREKIAAVNGMIAKYQGGVVHYMDIGARFLQPDGTISKAVMKDFLHLGSKGYDIWAEAIRDKVKELTGGPAAGHKAPVPP